MTFQQALSLPIESRRPAGLAQVAQRRPSGFVAFALGLGFLGLTLIVWHLAVPATVEASTLAEIAGL